MHGRANRIPVAPESDAVVECGEETERSSEAARTESNMVGEMAHTIWRRRDRRIARASTPAAYISPSVGECDAARDCPDAPATENYASRLDRCPSHSPRTQTPDAPSSPAFGDHDLSGVAPSRRTGCSLRGRHR